MNSYRIVFKGQLAEGFERQSVKRNLEKALKLSPEKAEKLLSVDRTVAIKKNLDRDQAKKIATVLKKIGLVIGVQAQPKQSSTSTAVSKSKKPKHIASAPKQPSAQTLKPTQTNKEPKPKPRATQSFTEQERIKEQQATLLKPKTSSRKQDYSSIKDKEPDKVSQFSISENRIHDNALRATAKSEIKEPEENKPVVDASSRTEPTSAPSELDFKQQSVENETAERTTKKSVAETEINTAADSTLEFTYSPEPKPVQEHIIEPEQDLKLESELKPKTDTTVASSVSPSSLSLIDDDNGIKTDEKEQANADKQQIDIETADYNQADSDLTLSLIDTPQTESKDITAIEKLDIEPPTNYEVDVIAANAKSAIPKSPNPENPDPKSSNTESPNPEHIIEKEPESITPDSSFTFTLSEEQKRSEVQDANNTNALIHDTPEDSIAKSETAAEIDAKPSLEETSKASKEQLAFTETEKEQIASVKAIPVQDAASASLKASQQPSQSSSSEIEPEPEAKTEANESSVQAEPEAAQAAITQEDIIALVAKHKAHKALIKVQELKEPVQEESELTAAKESSEADLIKQDDYLNSEAIDSNQVIETSVIEEVKQASAKFDVISEPAEASQNDIYQIDTGLEPQTVNKLEQNYSQIDDIDSETTEPKDIINSEPEPLAAFSFNALSEDSDTFAEADKPLIEDKPYAALDDERIQDEVIEDNASYTEGVSVLASHEKLVQEIDTKEQPAEVTEAELAKEPSAGISEAEPVKEPSLNTEFMPDETQIEEYLDNQSENNFSNMVEHTADNNHEMAIHSENSLKELEPEPETAALINQSLPEDSGTMEAEHLTADAITNEELDAEQPLESIPETVEALDKEEVEAEPEPAAAIEDAAPEQPQLASDNLEIDTAESEHTVDSEQLKAFSFEEEDAQTKLEEKGSQEEIIETNEATDSLTATLDQEVAKVEQETLSDKQPDKDSEAELAKEPSAAISEAELAKEPSAGISKAEPVKEPSLNTELPLDETQIKESLDNQSENNFSEIAEQATTVADDNLEIDTAESEYTVDSEQLKAFSFDDDDAQTELEETVYQKAVIEKDKATDTLTAALSKEAVDAEQSALIDEQEVENTDNEKALHQEDQVEPDESFNTIEVSEFEPSTAVEAQDLEQTAIEAVASSSDSVSEDEHATGLEAVDLKTVDPETVELETAELETEDPEHILSSSETEVEAIASEPIESENMIASETVSLVASSEDLEEEIEPQNEVLSASATEPLEQDKIDQPADHLEAEPIAEITSLDEDPEKTLLKEEQSMPENNKEAENITEVKNTKVEKSADKQIEEVTEEAQTERSTPLFSKLLLRAQKIGQNFKAQVFDSAGNQDYSHQPTEALGMLGIVSNKDSISSPEITQDSIDEPEAISSDITEPDNSDAQAHTDTPAKSDHESTNNGPRELPFGFVGNGKEYFRVWLVNALLTVITLGIYSAWAKVRNKQYIYNHTTLDDHNFNYFADAKKILIGRVIFSAVLAFLLTIISLFPVMLTVIGLLFALAIPYFIHQSMRFNLSNTSYRNVRFHFEKNIKESYIAYLALPAAAVFTLAIAWPLAVHRQKQFLINNSNFGSSEFECDFSITDIYKIFMPMLVSIIAGLLIISLAFQMPDIPTALLIITAITGLLIGLFIYCLYKVNLQNLIINRLYIDENSFTSNMEVWPWFRIKLTNILLIIVTLGLFTPFATVRNMKYLTSVTTLLPMKDLGDFTEHNDYESDTIGAAATDILDLDIGII